jgi:hypothetical protein
MTDQKRKPPVSVDMGFDEALKRFVQTNPSELIESLAGGVLESQERIKKRIEGARQEIEDGARPKKGRFRL